jgi:hypothetical protein
MSPPLNRRLVESLSANDTWKGRSKFSILQHSMNNQVSVLSMDPMSNLVTLNTLARSNGE